MMRIALFLLVSAFACTAYSQAPAWYTVDLSAFKAIDYSTSEINIQTESGAQAPISQGSSTYQAAEIKITPPSGKENSWLAMILSVAATGSKIRVHGVFTGTTLTVSNTGRLTAIF